MERNTEGKRDEALSFLVNHDTGVLATVSSEGQPSARTIYYTCDDSFNIYFITLKNTRKVAHIASNERAAFVVSETDVPHTIQLEGRITDVSETATDDALLTDFIRRLMSYKPYGIPLGHFDANVLGYYRLTPAWIRWGDFTFGSGTDAVLTELSPSDS